MDTLMPRLEYDCENCGACCRCFPIFASETDAEREPAIRRETRQLEPHLATQDKAYQMHPLPFLESCAFLKEDQLCRIYATRPTVCRRFEAGSDQCIEARERMGVGRTAH
ncbi:YkgJ family cysteine cluster protein [Coraliomargarita sp. SDUM461003]|uniref:YkgJ family cysteine cluster protein n=1 Tax=Thalassobacterium maritimum TaxID=3041265 RepID=A0ABU1AVD6_9BACT|nr:YkgJ family cysteine cluster protein [Coraliomargarita sp. SDUM461003]MDQ8208110.1 YkgJ family cysteine cluster protein [Coraliomargarita sp. SDUM461003]